jgi:hypothetical protein
MPTMREISESYIGPKSICTCGHAGNIANEGLAAFAPVMNLHAGIIGHGYCTLCKGCDKFTWKEHTEAFKRALAMASDSP